MNHTLMRACLGLGAALAVSSSSLAAPSTALGSAAAPPAKHCFNSDTVGAAARGASNPRAHDHRGIGPAEQRRIARRTAKILASRRPVTTPKVIKVPVYVHVMTSKTGAGNVSDARIVKQIQVLNQTYGGQDVDHPGGTRTGLEFTLAGTDRIANDIWHTDGASETYRAQTRRGGRTALNIWLVDFEYLGIATFPWDDAAKPAIDGIRVQVSSLPGGSATHYNAGKTATHEAGHWLGLFHTFQDGCTGPGDEVADTPSQGSPSTGCPEGRDSCSATGADPIHNYMDYSYDACYRSFSGGQVTRMRTMWRAYRA